MLCNAAQLCQIWTRKRGKERKWDAIKQRMVLMAVVVVTVVAVAVEST